MQMYREHMPILKPYPSEKQKLKPSVGTAGKTVRQKEAQLVVTSGSKEEKRKRKLVKLTF